jgi:hypothetical protein
MNADHLRKNVGEHLRLRPYPQLVESYGSGISVLSSGGPRYEKNVVLVGRGHQQGSLSNFVLQPSEQNS